MSRRYKWLFTEEWDEGCKEKVAIYGKKSVKEIDNIRDQMERYSPYDYCVANEFDTEAEYQAALDARVKSGCKMTHYEITEVSNNN